MPNVSCVGFSSACKLAGKVLRSYTVSEWPLTNFPETARMFKPSSIALNLLVGKFNSLHKMRGVVKRV